MGSIPDQGEPNLQQRQEKAGVGTEVDPVTTWDEHLNIQTGMAYHEFLELVGRMR